MSAAYATSHDVADRWRPLTPDEHTRAQVLCNDASARIRRRFRTTDARIAAGDLERIEVTAVVAGMVKRAMITGGAEGVTQESSTAGPFATTQQYANPMGNLFFTGDDIIVLTDPTARRRAFSVDLTPGS